RPGVSPELASRVRRQLMSRWIWVSELSFLNEFRAPEKLAFGNIIQDSASYPGPPRREEVLLFHLPGYLSGVFPDGRFWRDDVYYERFVRYDREDVLDTLLEYSWHPRSELDTRPSDQNN